MYAGSKEIYEWKMCKNKFERISVYYSGALVGGRGVNVFLCTFVASKSINMCQLRSAKWLYFFCTQLRCILAYFIENIGILFEILNSVVVV